MTKDAVLAEALQGMIDRAEADIAEAQEAIRRKELLVIELRWQLEAIKQPSPVANGRPVRPAGRQSLADRIAGVLRGSKKPMRVSEVADRLRQEGVQTASHRGLLPMVASVLSKRKNRFEQVERGVYRLKEGA